MTKKGIESSISKQLFDALDRIEKLEKKLDEAYTKIDALEKDANETPRVKTSIVLMDNRLSSRAGYLFPAMPYIFKCNCI